MFINNIFLGFLFISTIAFSQTKKTVDTIFVHEKVFVYKTISKTKKITQQILVFDSIARKKLLELKHFKINIVADTLSLKRMVITAKKESKKKKNNLFHIDNYGVSVQFLFSKQSEIRSYGGGIGLFVRKNIYKKKLLLNFEFLVSEIFSFIDTKSIDGYFITTDAVISYEPKNIKTQQLSLPITLYWNLGKFKPIIGIAYTQKKTELDFFSYPNNTTLTTIQASSYKLKSNYIDFILGVEYDINKRMSVLIKLKQTVSKISNSNNSSESIKPLEYFHFFQNQVAISVLYKLKK